MVELTPNLNARLKFSAFSQSFIDVRLNDWNLLSFERGQSEIAGATRLKTAISMVKLLNQVEKWRVFSSDWVPMLSCWVRYSTWMSTVVRLFFFDLHMIMEPGYFIYVVRSTVHHSTSNIRTSVTYLQQNACYKSLLMQWVSGLFDG